LVLHFSGDKLLSDITDEDVAKMVATRRKNRAVPARGKNKPETYPFVSPGTVNHTTVRLQAMFTHAKENWKDDKRAKIRFAHEPIWKKHKLNVPRKVARLLKDGERECLDTAVRADYEPLVAFASTTALRFNSCVTLKWTEVRWAEGIIEKPGKRKPGGREKIERVPITDRVREILEPLIGHHSEFVFTFVAKRRRIKGKRYPVTSGGTATMWKRLCDKAEVKNFGFHGLRRDRATKVWRETRDIVAVSRLLNHSDIATTMRYIGVDTRDVAEAMEATELADSTQRGRPLPIDPAKP
jgi:integrase